MLNDSLRMFLFVLPAIGAFVAYLYAASRLDSKVRERFPELWDEIVGESAAHSSSNAMRLFRNGRTLRAQNDVDIARQLDLIRYIAWAFVLGVLFAFMFAE